MLKDAEGERIRRELRQQHGRPRIRTTDWARGSNAWSPRQGGPPRLGPSVLKVSLSRHARRDSGPRAGADVALG